MKYDTTKGNDHAVAIITEEAYVFEDGEVFGLYTSEFKDPYLGEMQKKSWVVNLSKGIASSMGELSRKINA